MSKIPTPLTGDEVPILPKFTGFVRGYSAACNADWQVRSVMSAADSHASVSSAQTLFATRSRANLKSISVSRRGYADVKSAAMFYPAHGLASIGSVGFPLDSDNQAAYAIAGWDGRSWQLEHRLVAYDHLRVARLIERLGQPSAERYAQMIREACWLPAKQHR